MMQFVKASAADRVAKARAIDPALFDRLMAIARVGTFAECWPVTCSTTRDGYGQIRVNGPKKRAHRLMFSLFYPGVPTVVVRHACNNPSCINPAHLRPGTQKDNAADRVNSGRTGDVKGAKNGRAVLTEDQVRSIRASLEGAASVARRLGVTRQTIHAIRKGRLWSHLS